MAAGQIAVVKDLHGPDLLAELLGAASGQGHNAILVSLALADDDLTAGEVEILDAEAAALQQPQARPVHQLGHEPIDTSHSA